MLTYNVCVGTCHRSSFVVISSCESQTLVHTPSLSLPHTHFSFSLCGRKVAFKLSPWRRRGCISGVQEVSPRVEWCSNHLKTNPAAMKFHHKGPAACVCVCARALPGVCVPDVIKMSPSICNMLPLRVSLSGGQSPPAAGSK